MLLRAGLADVIYAGFIDTSPETASRASRSSKAFTMALPAAQSSLLVSGLPVHRAPRPAAPCPRPAVLRCSASATNGAMTNGASMNGTGGTYK